MPLLTCTGELVLSHGDEIVSLNNTHSQDELSFRLLICSGSTWPDSCVNLVRVNQAPSHLWESLATIFCTSLVTPHCLASVPSHSKPQHPGLYLEILCYVKLTQIICKAILLLV